MLFPFPPFRKGSFTWLTEEQVFKILKYSLIQNTGYSREKKPNPTLYFAL